MKNGHKSKKPSIPQAPVRKPAQPVAVQEEKKVRSKTTVLLPDTSKLTNSEITGFFLSNYPDDYFDAKFVTTKEKMFAFVTFTKGIYSFFI